VDEEQVRLIVRVTARLSAIAFVAALGLFAVRYRAASRQAGGPISLFVSFIVMHTIHFSAVAWLAMLTAGENIRERDGWSVVMVVAAAFYLAAFGILRVWRGIGLARAVSHRELLAAQVGVLFIAAIFVNSYVARVKTRPVYWLWTVGMVLVVTAYLLQTRRLLGRPQLSGDLTN
jgi:hypothetical protein